MEGPSIHHAVHWLPKENVPFHCIVLDPGLLGYVGHSALQGRMKREGGRREGRGGGRGRQRGKEVGGRGGEKGRGRGEGEEGGRGGEGEEREGKE